MRTLELIAITWLLSGLFLPLLLLGSWIADHLDSWATQRGGIAD